MYAHWHNYIVESFLQNRNNHDIPISTRFPAVHLGLALLYKELNRYEEAKKYAESGIEFLMKGRIQKSRIYTK